MDNSSHAHDQEKEELKKVSELQTCKTCKVKVPRDFFEQVEPFKTAKQNLSSLGFTVDSGFEEIVKREVSGLCGICAETTIFKLALMTAAIEKTDKETRESIRKLLNAFTGLAEESVWIECKRAVLDKMNRFRLGCRASWRLFMCLCNMRGQPQHVSSPEAELMRDLRKRGYSFLSQQLTVSVVCAPHYPDEPVFSLRFVELISR